jgi:hypothetical protein
MMQVATTQAAQALAALRSSRRRGAARRRRGQGRGEGRARPARAVAPTTIDCALRYIEALPRVRRDRVVAARRRLVAGEQPTGDEVAAMIVRRSLCDQLR